MAEPGTGSPERQSPNWGEYLADRLLPAGCAPETTSSTAVRPRSNSGGGSCARTLRFRCATARAITSRSRTRATGYGTARHDALTSARPRLVDHARMTVSRDLIELLRIPSVSADPAHAPDVRA